MISSFHMPQSEVQRLFCIQRRAARPTSLITMSEIEPMLIPEHSKRYDFLHRNRQGRAQKRRKFRDYR